MSLDKLKAWVGRTQATEDLVAPFPVRALAATFDACDPEPRNGDPLPPLWHWLYFLDAAPQSKLGPDGHAERGDFLPPVPLPRRMWAGSRFSFDGEPVRIGDTIGRTSEIKSVEPKSGSTGSMVFVTVKHTISGPRGVSFVEEHDIVYREAARPGEPPKAPKPAPAEATWTKTIMADPVLLFRFSALTFNGHRIHYDRPYVTGTEGYPGLIVHGPLLGMLQIELARRANADKIPRSFEFRALSPVFAGAAFHIHGRRESNGSITTWAANATGGLAQQGKVVFR
ncbi:MAG: acyl-CoA dehydrogenase [Rhodospirillaceae bacterium]|nr:acyl-CoA dehydrogenase [Rhodospirillaceae bacterium]